MLSPHQKLIEFRLQGLRTLDTPIGSSSSPRLVTFEDVVIPEENVVGAVGQGFKVSRFCYEGGLRLIDRPITDCNGSLRFHSTAHRCWSDRCRFASSPRGYAVCYGSYVSASSLRSARD